LRISCPHESFIIFLFIQTTNEGSSRSKIRMNAEPHQPLRSPVALRCREIGECDIGSIIDLLTRGFVVRSRDYWVRALDRLMRHPTPSGLPKLGYLLEHDGKPVGVILLIFSVVPVGAESAVRCNISSWYVEPAFRSHASWLALRALKHKNVTYVNTSPAPHTRATIEAQGFSRYCNGQLLALPMLSRNSPRMTIEVIRSIVRPTDLTLAAEFDLLQRHADLGCVCLWCTTDGHAHPFAFLPRRVARGLIPVVQLVYCRDQQDFVQFAGPIGRYLAVRGWPLVLMDADGALRGLIGKYFAGSGPKYFKGPYRPRLGDLAFTEGILFGP
jgi:hypothetical protein